MSYPVPANETVRLIETLSLKAFDGPPLPELQALCDVAASIADAPIALVSLVGEDEQRFVANTGLREVSGTPRELAFCAHAIGNAFPFVVEDARRDKRFASNPMVTGTTGIRAYAAVPLETSPGLHAGVLCVIDRKSRPFSALQLQNLERLAIAVAAILSAHRDGERLIRELRDAEQREAPLVYSATHDFLTGLANARHFHNQAQLAMATGRCALVLIDVDHFKSINDRYGHAFGDECLKAFAMAIRSCVRRGDLAGRLGGDEFAVFLKLGADAEDSVRSVLARLRLQLAACAGRMGKDEIGKTSIGVALAPLHAAVYEDLFNMADSALYVSKRTGRDMSTIYDPATAVQAQPLHARSRLTEARTNRELSPNFLPVINLESGALAGIEAVPSWLMPNGHEATPGEIGAAFDDSVLSPRMVRAILVDAAATAAAWRTAGHAVPQLEISARPADLADAGFAADICRILADAGLSGRDLVINLHETAFYAMNDERLCAAIQSLRNAGIRIAADDVGTRGETLQRLSFWPVDAVRIAPSVVAGGAASGRDRAMIESITALARLLGLSVTAKEVETTAGIEAMAACGCDHAQGHAIARPMTAAAAERFLAMACKGIDPGQRLAS